jgi:hypothetical protein
VEGPRDWEDGSLVKIPQLSEQKGDGSGFTITIFIVQNNIRNVFIQFKISHFLIFFFL